MYSECCTAAPHHIWDELCSECLDHCEFIDEEDDDDYYPDIDDLQNY